MKQIITHFTDNDLYTFTVGYYIIMNYPRAKARFEFFDRNNTVYPDGFDKMLMEQMEMMRNVVITDEEVEFMLKKCYYLPKWYIEVFLRGFRFDPSELHFWLDDENHLHGYCDGDWYSAMMWEMPVLSCTSELMHMLRGDFEKYNKEREYKKMYDKATRMLSEGLTFSDFGTRRRFSFDHHDMIVKAIVDAADDNMVSLGKFAGTSNVYFAMKYGLTPIGTMSHQIVSFEENVASVFECNYSVMNKWAETYGGDLGTYLYDCFGDDVFFDNFSKKMAMLYSGLRVDSGDEYIQGDKIIDKYKELGINPQNKIVVFSNALDVEKAIAIHRYFIGKILDSYGIGTNFTCDIDGVDPMNIVFKLIWCSITEKREGHDCVKLSCDMGKTLGNIVKCNYLKNILNKKYAAGN